MLTSTIAWCTPCVEAARGALLHACAVRKPILSLGRLAQQEYWSDLRTDIGTQFFPDKIQTKRSHTQLYKEESLFFVKGTDDGCALDDSCSE